MNIKGLFTKQKMMRTVLWALLPVSLMSVYLFGWRHVAVGLAVALAACISEYLVMRSIQKEKTKISEAALVSAVLFTLTLPPETPLWIALVGIVFGIVFGKAVFGGFGRNVFNPALVGRCFIYIAFPAQMTMQWAQPYQGFPGGFAHFLPRQAADAMTQSTPMIAMKAGGPATSLWQLLLGTVPGSLGETSALLLILVAAFLIYKKVASWQIMASLAGVTLAASSILYFAGASNTSPLFTLLSGGFMFGTVLMATDPVSAPKAKPLHWVYGGLIALITLTIRNFSLFTEGMMFAILIANALTPLMELKYKQYQARKKAQAGGAQ